MHNSVTLYYRLHMPIIPCWLYITCGRDMLRRCAERKDLYHIPLVVDMLSEDTTKGGALLSLGNGEYHMILPEEWEAGTVHHEALHAATAMWYDIGAELEVPKNDEVLAYTMNYIADYIKEVCYGNPK